MVSDSTSSVKGSVLAKTAGNKTFTSLFYECSDVMTLWVLVSYMTFKDAIMERKIKQDDDLTIPCSRSSNWLIESGKECDGCNVLDIVSLVNISVQQIEE